MPNVLTFADPITIPSLKYARVAKAREVDDTAKRLVLEIQVYGDDDMYHPNVFEIEVTNGSIGTIEVTEEPASLQEVVHRGTLTTVDNEDIATAFDIVMAQYVTGGLTAVLDKLQDLGALPEGTAA